MRNIKAKSIIVFLLLLSIILISCEKTPDNLPTQPVPINLTLKQATLVNSENIFAFDIFSEIIKSSDDENIIISPLSISFALSMTVNGANNATRDSMLHAMRVSDISVEDLNSSYKDLTASLLSVDERVNMKIANSVWTEDDFSVKTPFKNALTDYYNAESRSFDIEDPAAPDQMNSWIEDNTNGLIKEMIRELEDNTVMLLINAIYFKGKWRYEFDKSETKARNFTKTDGSGISVQAMSQAENHKVYVGDGFVMAELPYGQGNFVMDIILPDNNNLNTITPLLTGSNFSLWTRSMTERKVNLYLPRFRYDFKKNLNETLSIMGMALAFTDAADFSNISDLPLLISNVTHQAFIETNEEGTEAAAATVVEIGVVSIGPTDPILIDVNRPFIYVIRETTTNTVIFMGMVSNPLAE